MGFGLKTNQPPASIRGHSTPLKKSILYHDQSFEIVGNSLHDPLELILSNSCVASSFTLRKRILLRTAFFIIF